MNWLRRALVALVLGLAVQAQAQERVLNVYNWTDYIDPSVLAQYTVPAVSAVGTVLVAPKVTIVSNKTSMVRGSTVTFSGAVTPNHSGKRVYLQRYLGSGRWANVTYKALTTSSTYAFAVKITTPGTFTYRVWFVADADHTNAYSAAKAIKVT